MNFMLSSSKSPDIHSLRTLCAAPTMKKETEWHYSFQRLWRCRDCHCWVGSGHGIHPSQVLCTNVKFVLRRAALIVQFQTSRKYVCRTKNVLSSLKTLPRMGRPPSVVQVCRVGCISSFVDGIKLVIVWHETVRARINCGSGCTSCGEAALPWAQACSKCN